MAQLTSSATRQQRNYNGEGQSKTPTEMQRRMLERFWIDDLFLCFHANNYSSFIHPFQVDLIHLASFVKTAVANRQIPTSNDDTNPPSVLMKMDIEGKSTLKL